MKIKWDDWDEETMAVYEACVWACGTRPRRGLSATTVIARARLKRRFTALSDKSTRRAGRACVPFRQQ